MKASASAVVCRTSTVGWFMLVLCLLGHALAARASADTVAAKWTFSQDDVRFEKWGDYSRIYVKDLGQPEETPGTPFVPSKFAFLVVPPGAAVSDLKATGTEILIARDVLVYPAQPGHSTNDPPPPFVTPDPKVYGADTKTPPALGVIQGTHRLHGYSLVAIRLNPVRYVPASREVYLATSIDVTLSYQLPKVAAPMVASGQARGRAEVAGLVANPQDVGRFATAAASKSAQVVGALEQSALSGGDTSAVYLLITNEAIAPAFQPLVDRRTAQGKTGKLVTTEWIYAKYNGTRPDGGTDNQTKIRNCVKDHYQNHGTVWVSLAGDDDIVPVRYCNVPRWGTGTIPCDLYYGGLDGTWDDNANGRYGEIGDYPDFACEVSVGRIPLREPNQAQAYINKVVRYETASPDGYANTMLLQGYEDGSLYSGLARPTGFQDHDPVEAAEWEMRSFHHEYVQPLWQAVPTHELFATYTSWDTLRCGDYGAPWQNVHDRLNWGYHHIFNCSHGNSWAYAGVDTVSAATLTNADRPSIFFVIACLTAQFDGDGGALGCLSEAALRNPSGGAVAYIGYTRSGWGDWDAAWTFYRELYTNGRATVGEAFAQSKSWCAARRMADDDWRDLLFMVTLHGDPALVVLHEESGRHLQMASPKGCEVIDQDADLVIRWNACGTGFAEGEMVKLEHSADGGSSWAQIPGADNRPYSSRVFTWESPSLDPGNRYRIRVTSISDPNVTEASGRDFTISPMRVLTVRSRPLSSPASGILIAGTHANRTDYTFSMTPGTEVSLGAPSVSGYNFNRWADVNGNTVTHNMAMSFTCTGNRTVTAEYAATAARREYYVNDEIAEGGFAPGSDDNDGLTPSTPVRHIQQIFDRYNDVATIHVSAGTYTENIKVGADDANFVLQGNGAGVTIIDGNQAGSCLSIGSAGSPTIRGLTLRNGNAIYGGGICCGSCSPTIDECSITGNSATCGGGIYGEYGQFVINRCTIDYNIANQYGGGLLLMTSSAMVSSNTVAHNTSGNNSAGFGSDSSSVTLRDNFFLGNHSNGWYAGGIGMSNLGTTAMVGNTILGNTALGCGGGIALNYGSSVTIRGNLLARNQAPLGGGIGVTGLSSAVLDHNTITGNSGTSNGGALYCENTPTTISNCILWNNAPNEVALNSTSPLVSYSDVRGGWPGLGNLDADPQFVDEDGPDDDPNTWEDNNYHIASVSPCRDAGDPAFVPSEGETDIDGQPRLIGGRADIGADEFSSKYTLTLTVGNPGMGRIVVEPNLPEYEPYSIVRLTAEPNQGKQFAGWEGDVPAGHDSDNPLVLTMDSNKQITGRFKCGTGVETVLPVLIVALGATLWVRRRW